MWFMLMAHDLYYSTVGFSTYLVSTIYDSIFVLLSRNITISTLGSRGLVPSLLVYEQMSYFPTGNAILATKSQRLNEMEMTTAELDEIIAESRIQTAI